MKAFRTLTVPQHGFRGYFYKAASATDKCIIVLIGDEGNDFMDKSCAKWLTTHQNCHALCIAVRQYLNEDTGVHRWPLDHIETAVRWIRKHKLTKIGILGMSMQASMALTAASLISDISLVIALSPNDFIPWGFHQGKIHGHSKGEWPSGTSAFSWKQIELPYQPAYLEKDDYWNIFCDEKKTYHELHSITLFEHSEKIRPIPEECFIPVENIQGSIILCGAEDDSMWNTARYINRMQKRLMQKNFPYPVEVCIYPYGTHLLIPEKMLTGSLPLIGNLISRIFASGRKYPKECKMSRIDLENKLTGLIEQW